MGVYEDKVKSTIKKQYGSIPKMSAATGIPATTIYHALERGMDNTTSKTKNMILDALKMSGSYSLDSVLDSVELELVSMFRSLPDSAKNAVLAAMRTYLEQ